MLELVKTFATTEDFISFLNKLIEEIGEDLANTELETALKGLLEPQVPDQNHNVRCDSETSDDGSADNSSSISGTDGFVQTWVTKLLRLQGMASVEQQTLLFSVAPCGSYQYFAGLTRHEMVLELDRQSTKFHKFRNGSVRFMMEMALLRKAFVESSAKTLLKARKDFHVLCKNHFGEEHLRALVTQMDRGDRIVEICAALEIATSLESVANFNWCPIYTAKVANYRDLLTQLQ